MYPLKPHVPQAIRREELVENVKKITRSPPRNTNMATVIGAGRALALHTSMALPPAAKASFIAQKEPSYFSI